jgi:hypothetical protein
MIRNELKGLDTGERALRRFGLLVGGVFLLIAAWFWYRQKPYAAWPAYVGTPLVALGLCFPSALRGAYLAWMAGALALGLAVTTMVLTLFYYLVITPAGLLARCLGRDFLSRRWDPQAPSYWLQRGPSAPKVPADYEKQY